jgi:hypothetical protein
MENFKLDENKKPLDLGLLRLAPTDGLFANIPGKVLGLVREAVDNDSQLLEYYELAKKKLSEGKPNTTIHRGLILNLVHEALSEGGDIAKPLAKKLEYILAEAKTSVATTDSL